MHRPELFPVTVGIMLCTVDVGIDDGQVVLGIDGTDDVVFSVRPIQFPGQRRTVF